MRRSSAAAWLATALLVACTSFPAIPSGICGNGVVESGEDCDGFPVGSTSCRPSGTPGACRLDCSASKSNPSPRCPTGYGCGVDSICRAPLGTFDRVPESVAAGAWRIATADFDRDGRADVLTRAPADANGASELRVHYLSHDLSLARSQLIPTPVASPSAVDVDGDGAADLAFAYQGLGVMLGRSDRTFEPVAYPSFIIGDRAVRLVPFVGLNQYDAQLALFVQSKDGGSVVHADALGNASGTFAQLPGGPDDAAGDTVVARFFEGLSPHCEQLAFAFASGGDTSHAYVVSPCKAQPGGGVTWSYGAPPIAIALPSGVTIDVGVRAFDVNDDGHVDLLVGGKDGAMRGTFVAYSDGRGAFRSRPDPRDPASQPNTASRLTFTGTFDGVSFSPRLPLDFGDMNSDGRPDFITPSQIFMSRFMNGVTTYGAVQSKGRGAWTEARIGDFNADGTLDIVAASANELDLDFFNGTGSSLLNPFSLSTSGPIAHLALADFDGDRVTDVAFAQLGRGHPDTLHIAFGRFLSAPSDPIRVGSFPKIVQTAAVGRANSAVADIAVLSQPPSGSSNGLVPTSIALLLTNGARQPLAPLQLTSATMGFSTPSGVPYAVSVASFTGAHATDALMFATDSATDAQSVSRVWLARGAGGAQFGPATQVDVLPAGFSPIVVGSDGAHVSILTASGDIDGDGVPELVAIAPQSDEKTGAALLVIRVHADGSPAFAPVVALPRPASLEGQLALADLDGDNAVDALWLTGTSTSARELVVLWNDRRGGFSGDRFTSVQDPSDDAPQGFATVRARASAVPNVVYVTRTSVVVARLGSSRSVVERRVLDVDRTDATGIAAGDFDGDGVDDLAVADASNVVLYRGRPVLP